MNAKLVTTFLTTTMAFLLLVTVVPNIMADSATKKDKTIVNSSNNAVIEQININNADAETLTQIKGVGEKMAERIINYRESNGSFTKIEDLLNVKGIGDKTLEKIKPFIKVS